MSAPSSFRVERRGDGVVVVTIDRPERRNALMSSGWDELADIGRSIATRPDDRVVVLTGAGGTFCAGADLDDPEAAEATASTGKALAQMRRVAAAAQVWHDLPQPTVAAVAGHAVGAGASLALGCDMVVAAQGAVMRFPFVGLGLVMDSGASWLLPRLLGPALARQVVMLGRPLTAEAADAIGLLAAPPCAVEDLEDRTLDLAAELLESAPLSLTLAKQLLDTGPAGSFADALAVETRVQALALGTEDCAEAMAAFAERRPAEFRGR